MPTGATHEVEVDRLFFSTTDRRGVITQANSVFVDMARLSRGTLIGAPHNIIRHPDMPAGAFRLVWNAILAGHPTVAYVKNLAGDGSTYWAFATLMPAPDGFLSVRSRPCDTAVLPLVNDLYGKVREQERELRAGGFPAAEAAQVGADALEEALRAQGFESYDDFATRALPAEVAARSAQVRELPGRRTNNPSLADLLSTSTRIFQTLQRTNASLGGFQQNADQLDLHLQEAIAAMRALSDSVDHAGETATDLGADAMVLANSVPAVEAQCARVTEALTKVEGNVHAVRDERNQLLFRTALAQLQAESVGRYAIELVDGEEDMAHAATAIDSLSVALKQGLGSLTSDLGRNASRAGDMGNDISDARGGVERSSAVVGNWRAIIERKNLTRQFSEHLPELDSALEQANTTIGSLDSAAQSFSSTVVGFEGASLSSDLNELLLAARRI